MAVYEYKGLDAQGKAIDGIIDADTAKIARARLRKQGLFPTDISEQVEGPELEGVQQIRIRLRVRRLRERGQRQSTLIGFFIDNRTLARGLGHVESAGRYSHCPRGPSGCPA